ncbi:MAG: hypothetical protein MAG453_02131 [Calditrichaeota bacterium]|nr:hypothetical protein [Calditrichota bacterium]
MKRVALIVLAISLPVLAAALDLRPRPGDREPLTGAVSAGEPVVLRFQHPVIERTLARGLTATGAGGSELRVRSRVTGSTVVVFPEPAWPPGGTVRLTLGAGFHLDGPGYRGPRVFELAVLPEDAPGVSARRGGDDRSRTQTSGDLDNDVHVGPVPFTPNGDGFNDLLRVERGAIGFQDPTVTIYELNGIPVATLDSSDLSGAAVVWDGVDRLGRDARPGAYFIVVEESGGVIATGVVTILR